MKGNLFLTGVEWVNTSDNDDRNPSQDRLVFDFKGRQLVSEKRYFVNAGALCVRVLQNDAPIRWFDLGRQLRRRDFDHTFITRQDFSRVL